MLKIQLLMKHEVDISDYLVFPIKALDKLKMRVM